MDGKILNESQLDRFNEEASTRFKNAMYKCALQDDAMALQTPHSY